MSPIFFVFLFDVIPGFSIYSTTVFSFSFPLFEEIPSPASGQNIHLNVFFFFFFRLKEEVLMISCVQEKQTLEIEAEQRRQQQQEERLIPQRHREIGGVAPACTQQAHPVQYQEDGE